jgi:hypothetical protein
LSFLARVGGALKKRYDPLWEIVDERIALQGGEIHNNVRCPHCHVAMELWAQPNIGEKFRCGLCGAQCQVAQGSGGVELAAISAE